ncbi:hypothetical protein PanWU01x14_017170 [Parasponia andersonii]|uniref:Uncharacterized protein n=1 Tax=Parasponia andersonii TaxID=3476 RepID=A0A2P5DZT9_PARAD|nr:hypothetical protein PanWU01x14_017170 [Parasponia andersonii]
MRGLLVLIASPFVLISEEIGGFIRPWPEHPITNKEEQPDCGPHIPRLLVGAQIPDKDKFREVSINSEPTAKNENYGSSVSETIQSRAIYIANSSRDQTVHKGAGSGWGNSTGRGKPIICDSNSKAQNMTTGRMISGEKCNLRYDPASFRRTSGVESKKVVVSSSTGRSGNDLRESRTPEWSRLSSNEGVHPGRNGSFWPSRNNNWRQSTSQYSADKGSERD